MDIVDIFWGVIGIALVIYYSLRKKRLEKLEFNIKKTRIIDAYNSSRGYDKVNTGNAIKRAAVGGALFGKAGAVYGASTARRDMYFEDDSKVVFRVWWDDGSKTIEEVKRGSDKYKLFMEYLED